VDILSRSIHSRSRFENAGSTWMSLSSCQPFRAVASAAVLCVSSFMSKPRLVSSWRIVFLAMSLILEQSREFRPTCDRHWLRSAAATGPDRESTVLGSTATPITIQTMRPDRFDITLGNEPEFTAAGFLKHGGMPRSPLGWIIGAGSAVCQSNVFYRHHRGSPPMVARRSRVSTISPSPD
jgi:hypothetical protein